MTYRAKESGSEAGICDRDMLWRIFSQKYFTKRPIIMLGMYDKAELLGESFDELKKN